MGKVISCYNEHFYSDTFNFVSAGQVSKCCGLGWMSPSRWNNFKSF